MRYFKILILLLCSVSGFAQVQPMNFTHYSFPNYVNIGNGTIKTTDPSAYLEVGRSSGSTKGLLVPRGNKADVVSPSNGLLFFDVSTGHLHVYNNGWIDLSSAGGSSALSGAGTNGRLALWSGTSSLANSQVYDDGTYVGIGGAPHVGYKLYVNGSFYAAGNITVLAAVHTGANYKVVADASGIFHYVPDTSSNASWGNISGSISAQTDLVNKFNQYQPLLPVGTVTQYYRGNGTLGSFSADAIAAGTSVFAPLNHTQSSSSINDFTQAVRGKLSAVWPLRYDSTTGIFWIDSTAGGNGGAIGQHSLGSHSDVVITAPANNEVLKFNYTTGKWYNSLDKHIVSFLVTGQGRYRQLVGVYNDGTVTQPTTFTVGRDSTMGGSSSAQVQSDYGQVDPLQVDFIKNKPNDYTEVFAGTSTNQFTVARTPIASSITVYVNGQKIPKTFFTLSVNTVAINAGLLTFSTDTLDKIEIVYQSTL